MNLSEIGVTPRKEAQFKKRGIESVEDLLRCYPKDYRDYRAPVSVRMLEGHQEERAAVLGIVTGYRILQGKHAMIRLKDKDGGNISAVWFNQAFRVRQVVLGGSYIVGGMAKWDEQYRAVSFLMPDLFENFEGFRFGIRPVYRKIPGMSEEYFSSVMNDFNSLHCAPDSLLDLCGFSVRMDWKFTRGYQNRNQSAVKDEVLAKCKKNGLPVPTQMVETHRGLQAVWYLKEQKPANFLPVWNVLQNCLCEMFGQFGAASVRLGVCETVDLPVNGKKLLHSQKQPTSWDAMYNALRRAYYMRAYSAIAIKHYPNPAHRPTWYQTQQLVSDGTLLVSADEQPKPFIVNAPSYQWLRSGGWDEDLIVDAEPAVTTKCGRPMSSARASQTVGMMPAYYGEVAEDLLKLVQLRKGEFSAEMQQRLLFYIYVYSVLKISYKRDGDAPAAEAVRAADALMRHPMTPEMLEQRISGLRASARYDRTSVSRNRVISDLQITVAEQKQLKRLLGHEEDLRRKSKSGMLRSERDAALDTAIVEMLAQGKLHREIGEKLGMARESVTRRIRRNNLLREVQEARNALAKEQARAKRAEKTKDKDDDDKNGGAGAGGTQAASKPQKKSSRKPMSESRRLAVLAVQRVRRAKERLARKCSICIRNLAKRYYRLNAARVEWISGVSAAKSLCATPFPQLC